MMFLVVWIIGMLIIAVLLKYTNLKYKVDMPTLQTIGWPFWLAIELIIIITKTVDYLSSKYRKWIKE